jgi:hypothetical protein
LSVLPSLNLFYVCSHICIIILCFDLNYFFPISLESGILCLCIYSMNPLKMSKLVTEETNMNCSDWVNLNGSHIHKSTYNTYLQISNVYARIHIYFCQTFTMVAVIPRMLCIPLSIIDDLYIFSLDTMISIIA